LWLVLERNHQGEACCVWSYFHGCWRIGSWKSTKFDGKNNDDWCV